MKNNFTHKPQNEMNEIKKKYSNENNSKITILNIFVIASFY